MRIISIAVMFLLAGAGGYAEWSYFSVSTSRPLSGIGWHGVRYSIEIADTEESWRRGLGERDGLCAACAMLFVFPEAGRHDFWMKGMRFPLDIVWVLDGRVTHIERRIDPASVETFRPNVAADQVIEVNAGATDQLGEGDQIDYYRE